MSTPAIDARRLRRFARDISSLRCSEVEALLAIAGRIESGYDRRPSAGNRIYPEPTTQEMEKSDGNHPD